MIDLTTQSTVLTPLREDERGVIGKIFFVGYLHLPYTVGDPFLSPPSSRQGHSVDRGSHVFVFIASKQAKSSIYYLYLYLSIDVRVFVYPYGILLQGTNTRAKNMSYHTYISKTQGYNPRK